MTSDEYDLKRYFTLSLKYQLQTLACEAADQVNLYPDGCAVINEIKIDFYRFAEDCWPAYRADVTSNQLCSLDNIDKVMRNLAHPDNDGWSKSFLYESSVWGPIRAAARIALDAFGWELAVAPPDEGRARLPETSRYDPGEENWWRDFTPMGIEIPVCDDGYFSGLARQWPWNPS